MLSERVKRQSVEKKLFRLDGLSQDADAADPKTNQRAARRRALISRVESGYSARNERAQGVLDRTQLLGSVEG